MCDWNELSTYGLNANVCVENGLSCQTSCMSGWSSNFIQSSFRIECTAGAFKPPIGNDISELCTRQGCDLTGFFVGAHELGVAHGECPNWLNRNTLCQPECRSDPPYTGPPIERIRCSSSNQITGGTGDCVGWCGPMGDVIADVNERRISLGTCPAVWLESGLSCRLECYEGHSWESGEFGYSCEDAVASGGTLVCRRDCPQIIEYMSERPSLLHQCPDILLHKGTCPLSCTDSLRIGLGEPIATCVDGEIQINYACLPDDTLEDDEGYALRLTTIFLFMWILFVL